MEAAEAAERESLGDASGEISSYDNHPADLATETADRERDLAKEVLKFEIKAFKEFLAW